jgi:hypothetical protein
MGTFNGGYWNDRTPEVLLSGGAEFANGIFGVNSNVVPKLVKASNGTTSVSYVSNTSAPALPTSVVTANRGVHHPRQLHLHQPYFHLPQPNCDDRSRRQHHHPDGRHDDPERGYAGPEGRRRTAPANLAGHGSRHQHLAGQRRGYPQRHWYVEQLRKDQPPEHQRQLRLQVDGTIRARYYLFEFMNQNGINMTAATSLAASPGLLNPVLAANPSTNPTVGSFSDGILTNGAAGGTYLNLGANTFAPERSFTTPTSP